MRRGGGQESSSSKKRGGGKTIINWSVVVLFTDFVSLSYRCHLPSNFLMLSDRFFVYCNQLKWKSLLHWRKHKCYFFCRAKKKQSLLLTRIWRKHHAKNMTAFFVYLRSKSKQKNATTPFFLLITKMTVQLHVNIHCKSRAFFFTLKIYVLHASSFFFDGIYCFCW